MTVWARAADERRGRRGLVDATAVPVDRGVFVAWTAWQEFMSLLRGSAPGCSPAAGHQVAAERRGSRQRVEAQLPPEPGTPGPLGANLELFAGRLIPIIGNYEPDLAALQRSSTRIVLGVSHESTPEQMVDQTADAQGEYEGRRG